MTILITREEILSQPVGQVLNIWVAVGVMGLDPLTFNPREWNPSMEMSAAWEVEERIKELRLHTGYVSCLKQVLVRTGEYVGMFDYIHATAEQRCKAALLSVLNL
jgi:hypothetical protein